MEILKVLIVDDEQLVRWFLERALKRWNFEVTSVSNAHDALEQIDSKRFDLIFTDLKMPAGSGSLILKKIGEMQNAPRLIVCSAYITPEMEEEFRNKGILTLKKPFKLDELENSLKMITAP
jgi:DNA-binding NtrC family response regulator